MTLVCDFDPVEADKVVELAIRIWKICYFNVRNGNSHKRIDAGIKRSRANDDADELTLSGFIKKRRTNVKDQVMNSTTKVVSAQQLEGLTSTQWTAEMAKEEGHMKEKRARRLMQVVASTGGASTELLGGMQAEEIREIYEANEARLAKQRSHDAAAKRRVFAPRVATDMKGKVVKLLAAADTAASRAAMRDIDIKTNWR